MHVTRPVTGLNFFFFGALVFESQFQIGHIYYRGHIYYNMYSNKYLLQHLLLIFMTILKYYYMFITIGVIFTVDTTILNYETEPYLLL